MIWRQQLDTVLAASTRLVRLIETQAWPLITPYLITLLSDLPTLRNIHTTSWWGNFPVII